MARTHRKFTDERDAERLFKPQPCVTLPPTSHLYEVPNLVIQGDEWCDDCFGPRSLCQVCERVNLTTAPALMLVKS